MAGTATATIVLSSTIINAIAQSTASAAARLFGTQKQPWPDRNR